MGLLISGSAASVGSAVAETRIIYVGKHGNDANTGTSIGAAKLTIASARTAAFLLTPTNASKS